MAVFKCKMCGAPLETENDRIAVCGFCGSKQTLPKIDDERKANLYDRAEHLRRNNEFDKAMGIYEQILVLGTRAEHFNAVWVKNEWSRFLSLIKNGAEKILIPDYKDMYPYDLPEEFSHLQAQDMSKLGFMQDIIHGIKKIVKTEPEQTTVVKETVVAGGNANTDALLERAFMFLEDGDFVRADEFCEQVLNQDPKNANAYLGKLMAELRVSDRDGLKNQAQPFDNNNNFKKAVRFADEELKIQEIIHNPCYLFLCLFSKFFKKIKKI